MRIAYFLTHPIQYQVPMIRHLRAGGVDVEVVYGSSQGAEGYFDAGFSRQIVWDVPLLEGYPHRILPSSQKFRALVQACRETMMAMRADAVWVHGWGFKLSRAAWLAAKQLRLPVLLRGEAHLACVQSKGLKRLAHRAFLSVCFRGVRHFLAIGSANRHFYRSYGVAENRITLMPYAVDNDFFQARCREASMNREALRAEMNLLPGKPVILFCGKLISKKSPTLLIEALGRMNGEARPSLILAGDGEMRSELEAAAGRHAPGSVIFAGFRNQTELPAFYDLCDALVLPSDFEPWGLVVNEAMNAGRAVVVSDRVGSGFDLVETGVNGAVFPAGDTAALARALERLFSEPGLVAAAGARSLEIIRKWSFAEDLHGMKEALSLIEKGPERRAAA